MNAQGRDARQAAIDTILKLRKAGHVALLAGGCVRDMLAHKTPKDYDVATDATPDRVSQLFPRARRVGAQFGVMLVRRRGHDIEVATFRSDGGYSDGRRPDSVTFGSDRQDALRRDFTINGMFFDPIKDCLIDYVGGQEDMDARLIRTIGEPAQRFDEDHLRMLRAVRFAASMGFSIHDDTLRAIQRHAPKLARISAERIWLEIERMLTDASRSVGWALLIESGLRPHLAASWLPDSQGDEAVRRRLAALPAGAVGDALAMASCLRSVDPNRIRKIGLELRTSRRLADGVGWLLCALKEAYRANDLELADVKILRAHPLFGDLCALLRADLIAASGDLCVHAALMDRASGIKSDAVAPEPLLDGDDLQAMGMDPGPQLGRVLDTIYRAQLNEELTDRRGADALAKRMMEELDA